MGAFPSSLVRALDAVLQRLSIDPIAFRALVHSFLLMDLRNQQFGKSTATSPKARIAPLFWVLGQNLIVGLICSFVMFARVDALFFTLVGYSASILIIVSAVIVEFREIVLDTQDLTILGHRPVPPRTYAAARVTNLLGYLWICSCSAGLFPAIVGAGLRDSGAGYFPVYVCGALIGDFLAAGIVILIYSSLYQSGPSNSLQESVAWLQVGLILILFYGGQVILRDGSQPLSWISYQLPSSVWYLPMTWLADSVCRIASGNFSGLQVLMVWLALTLGVWWAVLVRLSQLYATLQPGRPAWAATTSPPLAYPGDLSGKIGRLLTRSGEERVGFCLTWMMLARDPNLRMRCWPSLAVVIAMFAVGALTGQLADPFRVPIGQCVMTLGAVYLVGEAAPSLLHQMRFSTQFEASWVLAMSPIGDRTAFSRGMCKALWLRFVGPLVVLALILFCSIWRDPIASVLHTALVGLSGWLFLSSCSVIQRRSVPFTSPLAKGESFGPIAGLTAATTAVAMTFAGLHGLTSGNRAAFLAYFLSFSVLTIVVHFVAFHSHSRLEKEAT